MYNTLRPCEKENLAFVDFCERISKNTIVELRGKNKTIVVGQGVGLKFNTSVGLNTPNLFDEERKKIYRISTNSIVPDIMMDLSTIKIQTPLYEVIKNDIGCPIGTLPHYVCFDTACGIDKNELLDTIEQQAINGVSFMSLHLTADLSLAERALSRKIPIISRGGSILLRDMKKNRRNNNIYLENFEEIIKICIKYDIVVSIGTTFRPSTLSDALDSVHLYELDLQKQLSNKLIESGVHVLLEGVGHISLMKIPEYVSILRKDRYIPFMPLGPIISDRTKGSDHITNAIGACNIAAIEGADIINTVTREEHTGGIPTIDSLLEAIEIAHTVSTIIDDCRFNLYHNKGTDDKYFNCMGTSSIVGCSRCAHECPFLWSEEYQ